MAILIFVLGAALVAAGGYLVFLSVDLVPTEMGLFYAMSGVILISASAIVLAIAALIFRLDRIAAPRPKAPAPPNPEEAAAPTSDVATSVVVPDAEPEIIARYNAAGAKYVLFADGAIEAETPDGGMRFASMDEFKAYIATRKAADAVRP
jgi:hypothetical protein